MAISDELNRIIQAKAGIRSALAEKGLTIGDSSTLDEYPALIQEMETGGGGSSADTQTLIDMIENDITSIVIPSGVKQIGGYAFENRKFLTDVTIPENVSIIGPGAFLGCSKLRNINVSTGTTILEQNLFYSCLNLAKFIVYPGVQEIQDNCFNNVSTNMDFVCLPTIPPVLGSGGLGSNTLTQTTWPIYVKNSVLDDYKNAGGNWNDVSTRIQPLVDFTFYQNTNKVIATGRDTIKLYVDASLCDSSVYTFPGDDSSHIITVESYDASLGLLDSLTSEVFTAAPQQGYSQPYKLKLSFNDGRQDVTLANTDSSTLTWTEYQAAAYTNGYKTGETPYIEQIWIGDECEEIEAGTSTTTPCKGTTTNHASCDKVIIGPHVGVIPQYAFTHLWTSDDTSANQESVLVFLGAPPATSNSNYTGTYTKVLVPDNQIQGYQSIGFNSGAHLVGLSNYNLYRDDNILDKSRNNIQIINGSDYSYIIRPNNTVTIQKYSDSLTGDIIIDSSINYDNTNYSIEIVNRNGFKDCTGITSVTLPNSVIYVRAAAFQGCTSLQSINLPNQNCIEENTFNGCSALSSVTIPNTVTYIGNNAFYGCSALSSVTIPSSVTSIGSASFSGCSAISSITIPSSVTYIGSNAFSGCSALSSVTIPNSLTSISTSAFSGCSALSSVTIPSSVTSIGSNAFSGMNSNFEIHLLSTTPPAVTKSSFGNSTNPETYPIYVPSSALSAYQADSIFSSYANRLVGE